MSVGRKWRQIGMTRGFARHICVERWGKDIFAYKYEQTSAIEAKKKIIAEHYIPLIIGKN